MTTEDGKEIAGTLYGTPGEFVVILAHMGVTGTTQNSWAPLARILVYHHDVPAVTFDFRGYGKSRGPQQQRLLLLDMQAVIDYLHQRGFTRIACVGASMGGTTCLRAALDYEFEGIATVGSPKSTGVPNAVTLDDLATFTMPKLFIVAAAEPYGDLTNEVIEMYEAATEPKELLVLPGSRHGTFLFTGDTREPFIQALLDFLLPLAGS